MRTGGVTGYQTKWLVISSPDSSIHQSVPLPKQAQLKGKSTAISSCDLAPIIPFAYVLHKHGAIKQSMFTANASNES